MGVHDFEPYLIPLGFGVGERRALLHILAKKKQSFHLAILLTCLFKAMFSAFSTCHMITFLLLRVCFFFQGFFWGGRKKKRSKSLHQPVKSPSPSGCGLQRASGARRSGPRAIGDFCRRSKEVSLDNSLGYPWPKEQTAFESADSPVEVFSIIFFRTYSNDLEVVEQQSCAKSCSVHGIEGTLSSSIRQLQWTSPCKHYSSGRENIVQTLPSPLKSNMAPSNALLGKGNSPYLTSILGFQKWACKKCKKCSPASPQS